MEGKYILISNLHGLNQKLVKEVSKLRGEHEKHKIAYDEMEKKSNLRIKQFSTELKEKEDSNVDLGQPLRSQISWTKSHLSLQEDATDDDYASSIVDETCDDVSTDEETISSTTEECSSSIADHEDYSSSISDATNDIVFIAIDYSPTTYHDDGEEGVTDVVASHAFIVTATNP